MKIIALIPAHNEERLILKSVDGLLTQSRVPDQIIVVADNCTDDTVSLVEELGLAHVSVFETVGNKYKKAGALNQILKSILVLLDEDDIILVQDADSILHPEFVENAYVHLDRDTKIGAVGGTFRAIEPTESASRQEKFLNYIQDNEYARYARDVRRLRGKCLVVTGTAAMLRAGTLLKVSEGRVTGVLPSGDGNGGVYDTTVLTEDNELSFAIMTIGMKLYAPPNCTLTTDAMTSVKDLWNQRLRWKRGAIENCLQYGLTRVTASYWGRQVMSVLGIVVTVAYLVSLVLSFVLIGGVNIHWFWLAVTGVFVLERFVTLSDKPLKDRLLAMTMYELPYDLLLQATHAVAYTNALTKKERKW